MKKLKVFSLIVLALALVLGAGTCFASAAKANDASCSPSETKSKKSSPSKKKKSTKAKVSKAKPAKPAQAEVAQNGPKKQKASKKKASKGKKQPPVVSKWSPNKFPIGRRGYCTWYADGRFLEYYGEKLEFAVRDRTNAKTWINRVANLEKTDKPSPGDIVVFKASTKKKRDPYGHVAFVEAVDGDRVTISHGNFDFPGHKPLAVRYIDGKKVTTDVYGPGSKPDRVRVDGCSSEFVLAGYLHKKPFDDTDALARALIEKEESTLLAREASAMLSKEASALFETAEQQGVSQ